MRMGPTCRGDSHAVRQGIIGLHCLPGRLPVAGELSGKGLKEKKKLGKKSLFLNKINVIINKYIRHMITLSTHLFPIVGMDQGKQRAQIYINSCMYTTDVLKIIGNKYIDKTRFTWHSLPFGGRYSGIFG